MESDGQAHHVNLTFLSHCQECRHVLAGWFLKLHTHRICSQVHWLDVCSSGLLMYIYRLKVALAVMLSAASPNQQNLLNILCGLLQVPIQFGLGPLSTVSAGLGLLPRAGRGTSYRRSKLPKEPIEIWGYEASPFCKLTREVWLLPVWSLLAFNIATLRTPCTRF